MVLQNYVPKERGCGEKDHPAPTYIWKTARRRAFFFPFLRRLGRLDDGGGQFPSVCTLVPAVPSPRRRAFSSRFSADWAFRRCRRGFCLRVHAGPCLSSPCRRAFFFPFLLRLGRFDDAGGDFASVCTLAPAVPCLAGVYFLFHFSAALAVSTMSAGNFPPCARWYPAFLHLAGVHFSSRFSADLAVSTMPAGILSPCARWYPAFLHLAGVHFSSRFSADLAVSTVMAGIFPPCARWYPAFLRLTGVHFSSHFSADLAVSTMPAGNFPPCARWPLLFLASPACIFYPVSPPPWPFRRCRRVISLRVHAGPCCSSLHRRAFFIPFLRRLGRFDDAGGQFPSVCTLAPAVPRFTGVHFLSRFSAGLDVSTMPARNLPPFARWPLPFLASPACIFLPVPRQLGRLDCDGGDFASLCTLAPAFLHLAGVHFLSRFSAGLDVSTMPARNLPPFARWPLPFLASPACIFLPVSPPA